jgi:hypothetical protein
MIEILMLLVLGVILLWCGNYCLLQYKEVFFGNPKVAITWDFLVQALGAGTSWGRLGVSLLMVGTCLCGISIFVLVGVFFSLAR